MSFQTPPPKTTIFEISFPSPGVLLATINREKRMNSIPLRGHHEGTALWNWLDSEPSMRVGIITGKGAKAFCAGADLIEQRDISRGDEARPEKGAEGGFAGLSQRRGKKPVIAAVNGLALGGGFEICLNCDLIVASPKAYFGLPEVLRGLYAGAGGLSRIVRDCGMRIGSELALTGRRVPAEEALQLRLINRIASSPESVLDEALALAKDIASKSPDAIIVSRSGLRESWETASTIEADKITAERYGKGLLSSENLRIGLEAFAAKKQPQWVASKL
ncbi:uncharacterized protein N7473_001124 [Penicillium subrubescens]|uniref:Carnitinyl-CoA dehydratase n=1 Tax=Penicillium subrubescens TaxID=1316194 RepID=A0A1Q5UJ05_9EURO|nr:uncharacterized protein N7473_001124 [Penicillium subrubescens]KAJ5911821.1 hypothetical protein N7473_001124 [Penicillium subrubescens]OKP12475.1 Carnitinyl-CoA dehydratase [Penicillium subrubescens]